MASPAQELETVSTTSCPFKARLDAFKAWIGPVALAWAEKRLPFREFILFALKKEVPVHEQSLWYYMGGLAMVFLIAQLLTGVLLMVYYVPAIDAAYDSVRNINNQVAFGWLIRSMHSWGANFFILVLFFHLFSTYFMKAYRAPREFTWLTGLGLIGLAMAFGFTGYLLPMDTIAFFATKVGVDVAASAPVVGELVATLLRGGADVGQNTLNRFFTIHVIALPAALLGLLGLHLLLIQLHGISEPESVAKRPAAVKRYEKFFPDFIMKDLFVWFLAIAGLIGVVCLMPWGLEPQADPTAPAPYGIRPEWYFLSQFIVLKFFPAFVGPFLGEHVAMVVIGAAASSLAIIPFIDTGKNQTVSLLATTWGIGFVIQFIFLTILGMLDPSVCETFKNQYLGAYVGLSVLLFIGIFMTLKARATAANLKSAASTAQADETQGS